MACLIHNVLITEDAKLNTLAIPFLACTEKEQNLYFLLSLLMFLLPPILSLSKCLWTKSAILCLNHCPYVSVIHKFTERPLSVIIHANNEDVEDVWAQISTISRGFCSLQSASQKSSLGSLVFETGSAASFQPTSQSIYPACILYTSREGSCGRWCQRPY